MENKEPKPVSKGIYTLQGKKINGERGAKLMLDILNSDDTLTPQTWLQWKKSSLKSTVSSATEDTVIKSLVKTIKFGNFGKQVAFNTQMRTLGKTFETRVDLAIKFGAKWPKTGLKSV